MTDTDAPSNPELQDTLRLLEEADSRFKERARVLFQNRPQSWRHFLGLLCGFHFAVLIGRVTADLFFFGMHFTELNVVSIVATGVSGGR